MDAVTRRVEGSRSLAAWLPCHGLTQMVIACLLLRNDSMAFDFQILVKLDFDPGSHVDVELNAVPQSVGEGR